MDLNMNMTPSARSDVCPPADASTRTGGTPAVASTRTGGKPPCWHGASCRKKHDPEHCRRYDHQSRPCKFGAKCRRQGRGCRYEHPGAGDKSQGLLKAAPRHRGNDNGNDFEGNGLELGGADPARPVPFIFLLVCTCAGGLLVLPLLGACNADRHQNMFYAGLALLVPYALLELLLFCKRSWVLQRFLEGEYSERATYRTLGCLWYPVPVQLLRYLTGDVAGNNIEEYATWETNGVQDNVDNAMGGNADGGQVFRSPDGYSFDFPGEFTGSSATVNAKGELEGLGVRAKFDGSNIISQGGAWARSGYWRLDWVTKVFLLIFVLGVQCVFVSVSMPPGIPGIPSLLKGSGHQMHLNAVFVVDGSASIQPNMWAAQQKAGEEFIRAFQKAYGKKHHGQLSMGIVQFSTDARTEVPLTDNIPQVVQTFQKLQQMMKYTYFNKGLSTCGQDLMDFEQAKPEGESFDICILITDGIDMSKKLPTQLQELVPSETAIFGIYVGADSNGLQLLKSVTECGKAESPNHPCDFFASASDYKLLAAEADEVANEVTRGVSVAMCAMVTALIGLPAAIGMALPYILWYASCTGYTLWRRHHESNKRAVKSNGNFAGNE